MPNTKPDFSIIIPVLNEEICLPRLLADLTKQTFQNFEVIVVDGHSDDNTIKNSSTYQSTLSNITFLNSPIRQVCHQRNIGAAKAKADLILFMDADNRLPKYFLQGIKYQVEVHDPDIFTTYLFPDSKNRSDAAIATIVNLYTDLTKNSSKMSLTEAFIGFKNEVFQKLNGFSEKVMWGEGSELYSRAHKLGYKVTVFTHPHYQFSFRRLKKLGTFRTARASAQLELARLLQIKLSPDQTGNLYPMKGGQIFRKNHKLSVLDRFLNNPNSFNEFTSDLIEKLNREPKFITQIKKSLTNFLE
jgi:glycosyltransferase involved in cell wall biosynthesis